MTVYARMFAVNEEIQSSVWGVAVSIIYSTDAFFLFDSLSSSNRRFKNEIWVNKR